TAPIDLVAGGNTPRKAVILLTDGADTISRAKRADAINRARAAGVPVYTIGLGKDIDRAFLTDLATASGGKFLEAPSASAVAGLYDELSSLLRSRFLVTLESNARPDVADRSIELTVTTSGGGLQLT